MRVPSLALLLAVAAAPAAAANAERGRLLYENHCTSCHTSIAHVRKDHKASDFGEIAAQVARWQRYLGLGWSPEDVEDVATWLDRAFYHFGPATTQ